MEWKSLLGVKPSDLDVLSAPGYFEPAPDNLFPPLLIRNNHFSYLPLLHVCIFTDVMDFANKGNKDNGAPRPEPQRTFAKLAVRGGLLFFIPVILSMAVFCVETLYGFVDPRKMPEAGPLIWGCFSLCWYLPIALTLPFVLEPYLEGYFLPRLVIPAVWGFPLVLFWHIQRLAVKRKYLVAVLGVAVVVQCAFEVCSVWY